MPVIEKQNPNSKPIDPSKIENPLDRITPVKNLLRKGLRVSIYGIPKTGKTRLVGTFPKPVLIIGTEDGTDSIKNVDGVDFVQILRTSEVEVLVKAAIDRKYATLALDTITGLQAMVYSEMLGLEGVPLQRSAAAFKNLDNQEYSYNSKRALNHLFMFKGNVVFTAHERDHTKKDSKPTDLLVPCIGSSISTGVAEWLNGICDHVCQTFKREKTVEQEISEGVTMPVGTGTGEYCLRIGPHPSYMSGLRIPLGAQMPDVILNPTYEKLKEVIDGKWKPSAQQT